MSYSCLPNVSSIIKPHNKATLSNKNHPSEPKCNCRKKDACPLNGNCLAGHVIYSCNVRTSESEGGLYYLGLTENTFKERWYQHNNTFKNQQKANYTELSKHIWSLKENNTTPILSWEIIDQARPYRNGSKTCSLCMTEKLHRIASKRQLLNKRSELFSTYRHATKFSLKNYKIFPPDHT